MDRKPLALCRSTLRGRRVFVPGLLALIALSCSNVQGPVDRIEPEPPNFVRVSPTTGNVAITEGQSVSFEVEAQSPGGHTVHYEFRVNGTVAVTAASYVFSPADTGHYQVEAIASDGDKAATRTWTVAVAEPPNVAPTAVLALDPASGTAPLSVRVRLEGADPDGQVMSYRLVVQGTAAMSLQRAAAIDTVLVLAEGSYTVSGVVEDDHGATATAGGTVQVDPRPNEAPVTRLVVLPSTGTAPLDVVIEGGGV